MNVNGQGIGTKAMDSAAAKNGLNVDDPELKAAFQYAQQNEKQVIKI